MTSLTTKYFNQEEETQTKLLFNITNTLLELDDLQKILEKAAAETIKAMNAHTVSLALYDPRSEKLTIEIIKRKDGKIRTARKKTFKIGEGVAGLAALKKEIIFVPDISNSPIFTGTCRSLAKTLIAVPMIFRGKLIGILNISLNQRDNLEKTEKEFLTVLSTIVAASIENSRLYETVSSENKKLYNIVENIAEGILVVDDDYNVILRNKKFCDFYERVHGTKHINQKVIKDSLIAMDIVPNPKPIYKESLRQDSDGEKYWLGISYSTVKIDNKYHIVLIYRDINEEKLFKERQKEFIYTTTHELRTPLTAIKGYLSMILAGDIGKISKKQRKFLEKPYAATERLVGMVEDLLSTARLDEKRTIYQKELFPVKKLMRQVKEEFSRKAQTKHITISIANYPKINLTANADYEKTKQALSNLVDNAIKYTPVKGKITLSATPENEKVEISVQDNGLGIPQKDLPFIFDKFYRVPNPESIKAGGTGLGLFIVKNLIKQQGGKIGVESTLKKGSRFYFTLPQN